MGRNDPLLAHPVGYVDQTAVTNAALTLAGIFRETGKEEAQSQFIINLFFSAGGLGIGFIQIPRIYAETQKIRTLAKEGPTEGGEKISLSPAASLIFPSPSRKDVEKVIKLIPSAEKISKNSGDSYFATKGYIVESDFINNLKGCNPLAVFEAFDALAGGKGSAIAPDDFDSSLIRWRSSGGVDAFAEDLQKSALVRLSSYSFLLFLLFIVSDLIVESGINGFMS